MKSNEGMNWNGYNGSEDKLGARANAHVEATGFDIKQDLIGKRK